MSVVICRPDVGAPDYREILRYAHSNAGTGVTLSLLDTVVKEMTPTMSFQVCYNIFDITVKSGKIDLGFTETKSLDLSVNLKGCDKVIVFAATLGHLTDLEIRRAAASSPAKALLAEAYADERIEALCDAFNNSMTAQFKNENAATRPRFSPGYGDLSLSVQKDIFRTLSLGKNLGMALTDSLLMTPTKSVTALIGVKHD